MHNLNTPQTVASEYELPSEVTQKVEEILTLLYLPGGGSLHNAIMYRCYPLHRLFAAGADVNLIDTSGDTPLHCALKKGRTAEVTTLLDHPDIFVDVGNVENDTPLDLVVTMLSPLITNNPEAREKQDMLLRTSGFDITHIPTREFLENTAARLEHLGADTSAMPQEAKARTRWCPESHALVPPYFRHAIVCMLALARREGISLERLPLELLFLLFEFMYGDRLSYYPQELLDSVKEIREPILNRQLFWALYKKDGARVRIALHLGANPNARDEISKGCTQSALKYTVYLHNSDCAKALLEANATVDVLDEQEATPLHTAAFNNSQDCAQILIAHGANVNAVTKFCYTPLCYATDHFRQITNTAVLLIQAGADTAEMRRRNPELYEDIIGWSPSSHAVATPRITSVADESDAEYLTDEASSEGYQTDSDSAQEYDTDGESSEEANHQIPILDLALRACHGIRTHSKAHAGRFPGANRFKLFANKDTRRAHFYLQALSELDLRPQQGTESTPDQIRTIVQDHILLLSILEHPDMGSLGDAITTAVMGFVEERAALHEMLKAVLVNFNVITESSYPQFVADVLLPLWALVDSGNLLSKDPELQRRLAAYVEKALPTLTSPQPAK